MNRLWSRAWMAYLAAGGLAIAVYFEIGTGPAQNAMYDALALSSVIAILAGVAYWKPEHRRPWYLLALGQALTLIGELAYDWYDLIQHISAPVPSVADAGFLLSYVFTISGVVLLARERTPRRDRGTFVDATLVATSVGLVWWVVVILPTMGGQFSSVAEQLTTVAYPMMDLLLLFVLVRVMFEPGRRTPAFRLLTLSILATLSADVAYNLVSLAGVYTDGGLMDAGWILGFLFMGAAGLHPSRAVATPKEDSAPHFSRRRLLLLTGAALVAPAMLFVATARDDDQAIYSIAGGSAILFVLVVIRMSGLFRDVESKVAELNASAADLRDAETRYRTVVEYIPAVTFLQQIDPTDVERWQMTYVSPQVQTMFGYTPEEWMRDRPWEGQIEPEDRERIRVERRRVRTLEPLREEYRMRSRDGAQIWVHSEVAPVGIAANGWQVWQGVMFDITSHKRAEETLRSALGREREAATRLRALDEMKNTFLHAVSHELRTPLTAIMGSALTLDRDDLTISAEDRRDLIRRMAANSRKLDRLLSELLDLDRLDRGIIEPQRTPTDVGALARRVIAETDGLADRRVDVDTAAGTVDLDSSKVERILENLIVNAIHHTAAGTPIWVRVELPDGGALVAVEDAGPGVPKELRTTIFEPFARGPEPSRHASGVGIGLSLVARFAELHGGRAWVEDRAGGGASFRVFLPGEVRRAEAA